MSITRLASNLLSPPRLHQLPSAYGVQHDGTGFPSRVYHLAVLPIEVVAGGSGLIDQLGDLCLVIEGHLHPHVFQDVGDLAEQLVNGLQTFGQNAVHLVFHRVAVTQVGDPDLIAGLADVLDATFALLQAGGGSREGRC